MTTNQFKNTIMPKQLLTIVCLLIASLSFAQGEYILWSDMNTAPNMQKANQEFDIINERIVQLDRVELKKALVNIPQEFTSAARNNPHYIKLPLPNGNLESFEIVESSVMSPKLAQKFPSIKTYAGKSVTTPGTSVRFSTTVKGFNAIIHTPEGTALIIPYAQNSLDYYTSFYKKDISFNLDQLDFSTSFCGTHALDEISDIDEISAETTNFTGAKSVVQNLSVYRIAVATTGNFYNASGGTDETVLARIVNVINSTNSIFERDAAVRFQLIDDNELLLFSNPATDGYTNGDTGALLGENTGNINAALISVGGAALYDIGHVFGTNAGGLASLGSVCESFRAQGVSSTFGNFSGALFYHIVSHEIGHQMNATHTFNYCGGNENASTGFEPASGSTIMSYAGAGCDAWLQPVSDPHFHHNSVERILQFSSATTCQTIVPTTNNTPVAEIPMEGGFYIPISTPFELTGEGTDEDGDQVFYSWEQSDIGPATPLGTQASGEAPLFRVFPPTESPTRIFPQIDKILTNSFDPSEVLPNYSRDMNFTLLVRDMNVDAGAVDMASISFKATSQAGPFQVMWPNSFADTLEAGKYTEFNWDVANTTGELVNCQSVDIFLSTDNGQNFDIVLAEGVPNTGSAFATIPDIETTDARIKIKGAGNIFFDVSNSRHVIIPPSQAGYGLTLNNTNQEVCLPATIDVGFNTISLLGYDSLVTLDVVSGLPPGAIIDFSSNPITPSEDGNISIDLSDVTAQDSFEIVVRAIASGSDTLYRSIFLSTIANDFSSMILVSPADGTSDIVGGPEFTWNTAAVADSYEIEIATSPVFAEDDIVFSAANIIDPSWTPPTVFAENTLYYWRVRGFNECGNGEFTAPSAFHTASVSCEDFVSNDVPRNISASGTPTIESTLTIVNGGTIRDINVPKVKGSHDQVRHLEAKLISPIGTETTLFSNMCPGTNAAPFDLGFDDQAPTNVTCPPSSGLVHIPKTPLSVFEDENSIGTWTLQLRVTNTDGEGGGLEDWRLQICGNLNVTNPLLIRNETMELHPLTERQIGNEFLLVTDDNAPEDLTFTVVTNTKNGRLALNGQELNIGDTFTQADINSFRLKYVHEIEETEVDDFTFTVIDGDGGWLGTPTFNIIIDEDAVAVEEIGDAKAITIYPNPTKGLFNIEFNELLFRRNVEVEIYNVQGQLMNQYRFDNPNARITINADNLSSGIYFVKLKSEDIIYTKKLTISK